MWLLLEGSALKQRVRKCYFRNMDDLGFYKKHMNLVSGEDPVSHACIHTAEGCVYLQSVLSWKKQHEIQKRV